MGTTKCLGRGGSFQVMLPPVTERSIQNHIIFGFWTFCLGKGISYIASKHNKVKCGSDSPKEMVDRLFQAGRVGFRKGDSSTKSFAAVTGATGLFFLF